MPDHAQTSIAFRFNILDGTLHRFRDAPVLVIFGPLLDDFPVVILMKDKVLESLKDNFRPEVLNRLDEILVFDVLPPEAILKIVDLRIEVVRERLLAKEIGRAHV